MTDVESIINWISLSDLTDEQKSSAKKYFEEKQEQDKLRDFQIKRLKENLKINTRFLNKAVEDLEQSVSLLKETNNQLGNFVKVASHDLKSPIRSISSFSALLSKMLSKKLSLKEKQYLTIVETSAKSMNELIDDLLLFTRINSEPLNVIEVNPTSLIENVLNNLKFEIESNKVKIDCHFGVLLLDCDPIKLKQVFQNLISNSIKFSTYDGNKPHVILDLEESSNHWVFSVTDNGIGIDPEFREQAFNEFEKLHGDSFEGTGIGLSIAKKIVTKHKGEIWIEPTTTKGTTIKFTIAKELSS